MTEILNYRYIGQTGEGEDSSKPSPSQFQLYVKDSRKVEGETYWINAQLAGSLWPLVVADFYLEHLIISEPEEEREGEEEGEWQIAESPEEVIETLIWDLLDKGETLLQTEYKVSDIAFTFDLFLPIEEDGETGGQEKGETLLLFCVEMSKEDSQDHEEVILQLDDLRQSAPRVLLKFLESNIILKPEEEDSDVTNEDL